MNFIYGPHSKVYGIFVLNSNDDYIHHSIYTCCSKQQEIKKEKFAASLFL